MKNIFYKKHFFLLLLLLLSKTTFAQWQKVLDNDSFPRSRPATFVIADTAYMFNGDDAGFGYTTECNGYTQNSNTWTVLRTYPGGGGDWGIRFQIADTAYVGGGANPGWQNDFWFYTPTTGWTKLGNTPNSQPMTSNMSFSIGHKGYVCGGDAEGPAIDSFWEYNPATNKYISLKPYPGGPRQSGVAFTAMGYGYVGLGGDGSGKSYKDMYRYTPATNTWDTMATLPADTGFVDAGFFTLCGKLIVTMGDSTQTGESTTAQTWMYDPYNGPKGAWSRLPNYPGLLPSYAPGGWAMGDTGFIYGGWNQPDWMDRSEMYRFLPNRTLMNMLVSPLDTSICSGNPITLKANSSANYLWNTSDTTGDITVTPTQSTTYIVTETSGACVYLDTVNVTVAPGPSINITPDPATVCNGQTIVLQASGTTNYQWVGTSDNTDTLSIHPTTDTTYELIAGNGAGCNVDTLIPVTVGTPAPLIVQPQSPSVCNGQSITLDADATGSNYTWSPATGLSSTSGTSVMANPTSLTIYTITGIDSIGCTVTTTDTVKINTPLPLIINPQSPTVCYGSPTALSVDSTGSNYTWSPATGLNTTTGYVTTILNPVANITYSVTGLDSLGCAVSASDTIKVIAAPNKPTITIHFDTLISSATSDNQWNYEGTAINNAVYQTLVVSGSTSGYSVTVTNEANGCTTTSDTTTTAGIDQVSITSGQVSIYPNPFSNTIYIKINSSVANVDEWNLQLVDVLGRTLYTNSSLNYSNELDLSNLPGGFYFITVMNKTARAVFPVVKQN